MSFPGTNALHHIESYILPLKGLSTGKEELLRKINDTLTEVTRSYYDVHQVNHYEFVSIHSLKSSNTTHQSKIGQKSENDRHHQILLGLLTNKSNTGQLDIGQLFLEDASGAMIILCLDSTPSLLGNLVVIPEWTYIPCMNKDNTARPFIEVNSFIFDLNIHLNNLVGEPQLASEMYRVKRSKRETNLSDRVRYLSPIFKTSTNDYFFMAKLELEVQPVFVFGVDKVSWWHLIRPGQVVDFVDMKYSQLNKGSDEERDVISTTSKSKIFIFDNKQLEVGYIGAERKRHGFISYIGTITDCSMLERGIFVLDNRSRLIVTHQPCETYSRGLRVGTMVCADNVHLLLFAKVPYLVCCTCSTIKLVRFSSQLAEQKPFVAHHNHFTKNCQEMRIRDYLHWLQLSDDLIGRFPFLTERKAASLARSLLENYLSYKPMERSIFKEFLSAPHSCPATSENLATPPKIYPLMNIICWIRKFFVESSETMPWSRGDEFDRLSSHNHKTENAWFYKVLSSEDFGDYVILGEADVCHSTGQLRLKDKSGVIDLEVIPHKPRIGKHRRNGIFKSIDSVILSFEKSIVVLQKFFLVLEKMDNPSPDYKIYLLADLTVAGNSIFCYKSILPKPGHVNGQDKYGTEFAIPASKSSNCNDIGLFTSQHAMNQEHSRDSLPQVHNPRRCEGSLESMQKEIVNSSCESPVSKIGNKATRPVTSESGILPCSSKDDMTSGELCHAADGFGWVSSAPEKNVTEENFSTENCASAECNDIVCNTGKMEDTTKVFVPISLAGKFGSVTSTGEVQSLSTGDCRVETGEESVSEEDSDGVKFHLIFMRKVSVLQTVREHRELKRCTNIDVVIMGNIGLPAIDGHSDGRAGEVNCGGSTFTNKGGDLRSRLIMNDPHFQSVNQKEVKMQLLIDENFISDYALIKSGNLYILETKLNISDIEDNTKQVCAKLRFDTRLYLAELKHTELFICGSGVILLPEDCINRIAETAVSYYDSGRSSTSVRSTLKRPVANRHHWGFSGIISSRSIKVSSTWGVKQSTSVVLLRVKDFNSLDEIPVYICPHTFSLPNGCLPGAMIHFRDVDVKVSQKSKIYCSVTASSEIRLLCFNETDLENLRAFSPMTSGLRDPAFRKTLTSILGSATVALNVTWEVQLDFLATRWAGIHWKCRICKRKAHLLLCTKGCPQDWELISQMSVIVDDGTAQAYLQIEQELFQRFLALPSDEWQRVLETAKYDEIVYQKETHSDVQQCVSHPDQPIKMVSERRHVELKLLALFQKINERPTYLVHCRRFNQDPQRAMTDQIRTIRVGDDEYLTKAHRKLNLQAIRISKIDYSKEIMHQITEMNMKR